MSDKLIEYLEGIAKYGESWGPDEDLKEVCRDAANEIRRLRCTHPWLGEGEQPASFMCRCGTKVYRSYEDYVDD